MKIIRYQAGRKRGYGVLDENFIRAIRGTPFQSLEYSGERLVLADVRLLAPCKPTKIVAVGANYRKHAQELTIDVPGEPLIFLKPPTAVIGPEDKIIYPESSRQVDYEGELGVVIGKRARKVSRDQVHEFILGYTCFNDVTARDLQAKDKQWTRSKSFDTFAPIGPCIETDPGPANLTLETYLNGDLKQTGNTADMVFNIPDLVSFISQVMTLLPGDVIATGTPVGVGPMRRGDTVEVKIAGIGTLRNHVA